MSDVPSRRTGRELVANGWDQGCLFRLPAASMSYLHRAASSEDWVRGKEVLEEEDFLVVVSQLCDIIKGTDKEPYVEVVRAYWTTDKTMISNASKNAVRHFCLHRRAAPGGKAEQGLIVDATFRIQIRKEALLTVMPTQGFAADDRIGHARFRRWLGARYNRQPVPDNLVEGIQRPVVEGLRRLKRDDPLWRVLDGISEILYDADDSSDPYRVEMFFLQDERAVDELLGEADADSLAGWISDQIKGVGKAVLDTQQLISLQNISVYDYLTLHQLPLDHYSLPDPGD